MDYGQHVDGQFSNRELRSINIMADAAVRTLEDASVTRDSAQTLKARRARLLHGPLQL